MKLKLKKEMNIFKSFFTQITFLFIAFTLFLSACKTQSISDTASCMRITKIAYSDSIKSDHFTLNSAKIKGKCLWVDVEYSGGCGDASFEMLWDGSMMKSLPPQVNFMLKLSDNDPCRSIVKKSICFDLSSVYSDDIIIHLNNWKELLQYKK